MTSWPVVALKRIASIRISNVDKRTVEYELPVRLCNYTDVYYRDTIHPGQEFMVATATQDQLAAFRLRPQDVLITKDSETPSDIGVPAYVAAGAPDLLCGYHLAIIRPVAGELHGRFLYWAMSSAVVREQLSSVATGITRYGLRADSIGSVGIALPGARQQKKIANFLDAETARLENLVCRKRRLLALLQENLTAATGAWHEKLQKEYGTTQLRRLIEGLEQGWSPVCDNQEAAKDEWGVLKTSSVSSGIFNGAENKRLPMDVEPKVRWEVRERDLLLTRGSGSMSAVGRSAVASLGGRRLMLSDLIYRLRYSTLSPEFAAAVLGSPQVRRQIESAVRSDVGQTLKIRGDDILDLRVPAVPYGTQSLALRQLEMLVEMHAKIRPALERQIELLGECRAALITAAVTGELEIPGAAA